MPDTNHFDEDVMRSLEREAYWLPIIAYTFLGLCFIFVATVVICSIYRGH